MWGLRVRAAAGFIRWIIRALRAAVRRRRLTREIYRKATVANRLDAGGHTHEADRMRRHIKDLARERRAA